MDITQIVLVASVAILTGILALVGFEVFLILRQCQQAMRKVNKILDDAGIISTSISKQVANVGDLINTAKTTFDLAKGFFKKEERSGQKEDGEVLEGELASDQNEDTKAKIATSVRRFFTRAGKRIS